jgi:hypothetical protein
MKKMAQVKFTKQEFIEEKQRRYREKSDKYQADFAPHNKYSFWKFCQHIAPDFYFDDKKPLIELTEIFRRVTIGELRKVLISFFPRGGKSRTTSLWIAWWLGYDPEGSFMRNCYNDNLAWDLSKSVLDIMELEEYGQVFPNISIDPNARSKATWQLRNTTITTYFGAGINGTITGRGCNRAAIFDDPIKNPEEALSESYLEKIDTFIEYALTTRVEEGSNCAEVIISTRWSGRDAIGLRENDKEWHKFIFPVLDENDKSICEAMFSTERALKIRKKWIDTGKKWMWDALYMCEPSEKTFAKLSLDTLKRFSMKDLDNVEIDERIAWCDYANKGTDFLSCPFVWRAGDKKYFPGVMFSNKDSKELKEPLIKKVIEFKPSNITFESQQGGQEFGENFEEKYAKILQAIGTEVEMRSSTVNKEIRILLKIGEIKSECYFLVDEEQDEHYSRFIENLTSYGKYKFTKDDAIDSVSGVLLALSTSGDVDIDYLDDNKILDIDIDNDTDELESDMDSDVVVF